MSPLEPRRRFRFGTSWVEAAVGVPRHRDLGLPTLVMTILEVSPLREFPLPVPARSPRS